MLCQSNLGGRNDNHLRFIASSKDVIRLLFFFGTAVPSVMERQAIISIISPYRVIRISRLSIPNFLP